MRQNLTRSLLLTALSFGMAACDSAPSRPAMTSQDTTSAPSAANSQTTGPAGALSLNQCSAPIKSTYRLTRNEIANTITELLKLTQAERLSFRNSMAAETSKTAYENDLSSLKISGEQVLALAFALDTVLTPEKIKAVIACGEETDIANACVAKALTRLASRAYGALSDSNPDVVAYKSMLASLKTKNSERLSFAIRNIFLSAPFLYGSTDKERFKTHLRNSLWVGAGDNALQADLENLDDKSFVKVLLTDLRSKNFVEAFLMRRFKVENLTAGLDTKDAERLKLLNAMSEETKLFIWDIFKNNRPMSELVTSKTSFIDKQLAAHYNLPDPGEGFKKVELPANRQGLLTQGSVLTATSKVAESNIISRGLWIVENVLCQHIPAPPADAPKLEEPDSNTAAITTPRQRLEIHRASPNCASCHNLMDPPGFALENFGPLGQYRDKYDNGLPVDSRAHFIDKTITNTPSEFFNYIDGRKDEFAKCVSKELLTYVMRRALTAEDQCAVDALAKGMGEEKWGLETALTEILSWYKK